MSGLYIHIPFCERKCSYCAFYSVASKDWKKQGQFFQSLETEIKNIKSLYPDFLPETIFIGGGTPTALTAMQIERLLVSVAETVNFSRAEICDDPNPVRSHCRTRFPYSGACEEHRLSAYREARPTRSRSDVVNCGCVEFSCEANPGTLNAEKLAVLRAGRVNRLSIGVQSFDSDCLEMLGRIHSAEEAEVAFQLARAAGFENISIDLMFGVPGQTIEMLEADLDRALTLGPEHIAIYNLMYEEGTPMAERSDRLDEEVEREMYDLIRKRLTGAGFEHYEISNFAKPGFECRHNLLYWTGGEYIGCGPSAHSHWQGTRWANVADLDDYCANIGRALSPKAPRTARRAVPTQKVPWPRHEFEETLDSEAKARETLVMGLRLLAGVEVSSKVWKNSSKKFQTLEKEGLLVIEGRHVRLSEDALFVSDAVFAELI